MATDETASIELAHWLRSPPGRYLLGWEQERLDHALADVFGYHALQLGLGELDALRTNRMPHRWIAQDCAWPNEPLARVELPDVDHSLSTLPPPAPLALQCQFDALPFPSQSLDLVVLAHTLEMTRDPHDILREVERVLMPEGRVAIMGFNPASLWGLRQRTGRLRQGLGSGRPLFLPRGGEFIGYWRLRDWLRLLGMEVEVGRFGCWRPPFQSQGWLQRMQWMESAGERWWPVLGAVYFIVAVKRLRGMRLVGLARRQPVRAQGAPAVLINQGREARKGPM